MAELYPDVRVTLLYQRDTLALLAKYGLAGDCRPAVAASPAPPERRRRYPFDVGDASTPLDGHPIPSRRSLRHTALIDAHRRLGAKLVGFGGWEMPLSYGDGTIAEHRACRHDAVVFDVSHLGTVRVEGADAFDRLQSALTNDLRKVAPGSGPVHPSARRGRRLGGRRHHRVVGRRRRLRRDAQRLQHRPGAWPPSEGRTPPPAAHHRRPGSPRPGRLATVGPEAAAVPRFGVAPFDWEGVDAWPPAPATRARTVSRWPSRPTWPPRLWDGAAGRRGRARPARRPRHPPARGRPAPARPRARPGHHPAPGRAGLGGRLGQGRASGAGRPWSPSGHAA